MRVRIYFFLSCKARIFFPVFNIRLYDKNSESDYYFFPPSKSEFKIKIKYTSPYAPNIYLLVLTIGICKKTH